MKRGVLFVLLLASPTLAQSALETRTSSPPQLEVSYAHFTLPNGLGVILHEDHSVPVVSVNVWYHVGSANERPGRTGFAR